MTGQSDGTPLVHYEYDGFGNVHTVTTRSGASALRTTTYVYDANNRVVEIRHPGYPTSPLGTEQFGYDAVGNLLWKRDGNSAVTIYKYDELNRLTDVWYNYTGSLSPISYPQGNGNVHYEYDGGSRLRTSMTDAVGTSEYEYDIQDRLVSYTPPVPSSHAAVEYTYNNLGQKTSVTNGSFAVDYEYYANGWLKAVTDGTNPYAEYTYDPAGNRTRVDLGNTTYTTYGYDADPRYRVSSITHTPVGSSAVTISYPTRDSAGNPLSMTIGNTTTNYTYDTNSRLVSAETTYAYDWVGNRNPSTHTYNAADQLTASPGHQYAYDSAGNLTLEYDSSGQTVQKQYSYTAAGLLQKVIHGPNQNDPASEMTWDADSNRVSFTSSTGGTWSFVYDTTAGIPAVIEEVQPDESSVYYVREPNGALIARIDGETVSYYHFDALGSTRLLTDADGAVTDEYTYDAWGTLLDHEGSTAQPYQFVGQLGYYTHVQDVNLPLLQLGVRFYDPETGRFTQVDPIPQYRRSTYAYVRGNPCVFVDPTGQMPTTCEYGCMLYGDGVEWLCNWASNLYSSLKGWHCQLAGLAAEEDCRMKLCSGWWNCLSFGSPPAPPIGVPTRPITPPAPPSAGPPVPPRSAPPRKPLPPPLLFIWCLSDGPSNPITDGGLASCYICIAVDEDGRAYLWRTCSVSPWPWL